MSGSLDSLGRSAVAWASLRSAHPTLAHRAANDLPSIFFRRHGRTGMTVENACHFPIDISHHFSYIPIESRSRKGRHREGALDCAERVRCPRAERHTPHPGGFGHQQAGITTGRWGAATGLGQVRAGNARTQLRSMLPPEGGPSQIGALAASQEAWPEVARYGRKPVSQNRGGTPTGERIPQRVRGRASCTAGWTKASVGVPLPFFLSLLSFVLRSVIAGLEPAIHAGAMRVNFPSHLASRSQHGPPGQARW